MILKIQYSKFIENKKKTSTKFYFFRINVSLIYKYDLLYI